MILRKRVIGGSYSDYSGIFACAKWNSVLYSVDAVSVAMDLSYGFSDDSSKKKRVSALMNKQNT